MDYVMADESSIPAAYLKHATFALKISSVQAIFSVFLNHGGIKRFLLQMGGSLFNNGRFCGRASMAPLT